MFQSSDGNDDDVFVSNACSYLDTYSFRSFHPRIGLGVIVSVSIFRRPIFLWSFCFDTVPAVLTAGCLSFRLDRPLAVSSVEPVPVDVVINCFALVELTCLVKRTIWESSVQKHSFLDVESIRLGFQELLPLHRAIGGVGHEDAREEKRGA